MLRLYKECNITRDRNARVDNIESYLSTLTYVEFDVQYQQIGLNKVIKLELPQEEVGKANYNYIRLNQDNKNFYYFINKATWKSTTTVEFEITLDTVNTFANDFTFNKKTHINRQHKDRIKNKLTLEYWNSTAAISELPSYTKLLMNFVWENESYDECMWSTTYVGDITYYKYENDHLVQTVSDITTFGRTTESGNYKWHVVSRGGGLFLNKTDEQMADDYNNNIYHVIEITTVDNYEVQPDNNGGASVFNSIVKDGVIRNIDMTPEGINPPQFKISEETIQEDEYQPLWNMVYIAENAYDSSNPDAFTMNNPLKCYLYPEVPIRDFLTIKPASTEISANDLVDGQYYLFIPYSVVPESITKDKVSNYLFNHGYLATAEWYNKNWSYSISIYNNGVTYVDKAEVKNAKWHYDGSFTRLDTIPQWIVIRRSGNIITYEYLTYKKNSVGLYDRITSLMSLQFNLSPDFKITFNSNDSDVRPYSGSTYPSETSTKNYWYAIMQWSYSIFTFEDITTYSYISSIPSSLKIDSRLMKIIQLPYVPFKKVYLETLSKYAYNIDGWQYDPPTAAFIKVNLEGDINSNLLLDFNPLQDINIEVNKAETYRDDNNESKIYNSEFYTPKFIYDSFGYQYILENINVDSDLDNAKNIDYKVSNTFSGNFLFGMNTPLKRSNDDYDNLLVIRRNNEKPIYTSAFMNYVRNGYNLDIKNKEWQLQKGLVTTGVGTAGGILGGLAMGAMTGSSIGPYGAIIGGAIGLASGLVNIALNQVEADKQIQRKLEENSKQSVSVNTCDDINLLNYYTNGNKAKYCVYQCSDRVKQSILDLFYYCGYKDDIREIPQLNTRKWFNYIQCESVFNEDNNIVYKEYLDDIKQRYQEGVTVYHDNNGYDWNQEYENWETSLNG